MRIKESQKSLKDFIVCYMNPYHIQYIKEYPFNTLDRLINTLDKIEESRLKDILGIAFIYYNSHDLSSKEKDFDNVKAMKKNIIKKSIDIANMTSQHVAVNAFTEVVLNEMNINPPVELG